MFKQVISKNNQRLIYQKLKTITGLALGIVLIDLGCLFFHQSVSMFSAYLQSFSTKIDSLNDNLNYHLNLPKLRNNLNLIYLSENLSENEPKKSAVDLDAGDAAEDEESFIDVQTEEKLIFWLLKQPESLYFLFNLLFLFLNLANLVIGLILARLNWLKNPQEIVIDSLTGETLNELKNLLGETQNSLFWLQEYLENQTIKASQSSKLYTSGNLTPKSESSFSRSIEDSQVFQPNSSLSLPTQSQTRDALINPDHQPISEPMSNTMQAEDLLAQANALLKQGLYDQALAKVEASITLNPKSGAAWLSRGCILFYLREYEQAIASIDQALHQGGDWPDAWYSRAGVLMQLQQYTEAIACYERATQGNPNYVAAWHERGLALMSLQRYSEALACFEQGILLKPNAPEFRVCLGQALSKLGAYPEAIAAYQQAIDLQPDYVPAWVQLGCALAASQRHAEAVAAYDRALKLNPDDAMVWNYLGIALGHLGNYPEALAAYNQALALKPNWPRVQNNRAAILIKLQRYAEAIAACNQAIAQGANQPAIWYNKACCYAIQGDVEGAIESLQQAIGQNQTTYLNLAQTDPDFDPIRQDPRFQRIIQHNQSPSLLK